MQSPTHYRSYNLDHLGLIAALYDELGIGTLIDSLIPQDLDQRYVSIGQAVKAMVINGLGFTQSPLYLTPHFFEDKPVEHLIGANIKAEYLNDTTLGRSMDTIFKQGVSELYAQISMKTVGILGLTCRITHADTTSFHTDGVYNSNDEPEEGVVHITKGYSRDHRPDLNQIGLQLICEHQAGIPLLMEPLNGNNIDKDSFNELIKNHIGQLKTEVGLEYLIADSALYTAKNLKELTDCLWISLVPGTIKLRHEIIDAIAPELMQTPDEKGVRSLCCRYAGINQRWVVIYSPESRNRATKSINKQWLKQTTTLNKSFQKLCSQNFKCEEDALEALKKFEEKESLIEVISDPIEKIAHYNRSGRPKKGQQADHYNYQIRGSIMTLLEPHQKKIQRKSCYILATNQLNSEQLTDAEVINLYKSQQKVERGFRFMKDPLFMASSLFLKSPKRMMVLMMIMTLCLLLYAALEYRIRQSLQQAKKTFPNQKGHSISNPTARWVFQFFSGIHVLLLENSQTIVLNMNSNHLLLLSLLGEKYEKLYSGSG
jgi:transposase